MPDWLRLVQNSIAGKLFWFFTWPDRIATNWIHWVSASINDISDFALRSYIVLTYDIANFSYYVGAFTKASRGWTEHIILKLIPDAIKTSEKYALQQATIVKDYEDKKRRQLRRYLIAFIKAVAEALYDDIVAEIQARKKAVAELKAFTVALVAATRLELLLDIARERAARIKADNDIRKWAQQIFNNLWAYARSILPTVDKEAADGYNSQRPAQASNLAQALTDLAVDNPEVRAMVGRLAGLVIDLAEVDDPLLRITATFLLKQVIDRLGADKLAGGLIDGLLGLFLGGAPPKTLQAVVAALAGRLDATEQQWAQFYANGGDDLERFGTELRQTASPLFLGAMAAFVTGAVLDPAGAAAATAAGVEPAAQAVMAPLVALLGV